MNIKIAPDAWEKSRKSTQPFRDNLARLAEVMKADPVPVSITELELLEALSGSSTGRGIIQEGIKAMDILIDELETRVKAGIGVTEKGAPRVMVRLGHTADPQGDAPDRRIGAGGTPDIYSGELGRNESQAQGRLHDARGNNRRL